MLHVNYNDLLGLGTTDVKEVSQMLLIVRQNFQETTTIKSKKKAEGEGQKAQGDFPKGKRIRPPPLYSTCCRQA